MNNKKRVTGQAIARDLQKYSTQLIKILIRSLPRAQLVEWLLATPVINGLIPVIGKLTVLNRQK